MPLLCFFLTKIMPRMHWGKWTHRNSLQLHFHSIFYSSTLNAFLLSIHIASLIRLQTDKLLWTYYSYMLWDSSHHSGQRRETYLINESHKFVQSFHFCFSSSSSFIFKGKMGTRSLFIIIRNMPTSTKKRKKFP